MFLDERNALLNETAEALTPIANVPLPRCLGLRSLLPHRATARLCATCLSEGVNLYDGPIAPGLLASGAGGWIGSTSAARPAVCLRWMRLSIG